jgi:hypothetical protein
MAWKWTQCAGFRPQKWRTIVAIDPSFFHPAEVDLLIGNAAKAKARLGWEEKTGLEALDPVDGQGRLRPGQDRHHPLLSAASLNPICSGPGESRPLAAPPARK